MSQSYSLKDQFSKALKIQKDLESGKISFRSDNYTKSYKEAISLFNICKVLIDQLGLYSTNEQADDISTKDIKYLPVDYHLANILARSPPNEGPLDPSERLKTVRSIIETHISFLLLLDSYKILPKTFSAKLQNALEEGENGLPSLRSLEGKDAAERRQEKIEMFKLEKSLEARISSFNKANSGKDEDEVDDEMFRQVQFGQLGIYAIKSFSAVQNLLLEVELLKNMPAAITTGQQPESSDPRQSSSGGSSYTTRLEQPVNQAPLLTKSGKINRPFTIVSTRDQIAKQAFGTGQRLPTMSVEEYLEEEMRRGGIIEGGGEQSAQQESEDEDDVEKQDQETYKARQWDEFTEANPRGSGNTINRG